MPLKLSLRGGQKIVINGAVIANPSARTIAISIMNKAAILRDSEIITADEATTPATRTYFSLQNLYLFPDQAQRYSGLIKQFLADYEAAAPSALPITAAIREHLADGDLYKALREGHSLIEHEKEVLYDEKGQPRHGI